MINTNVTNFRKQLFELIDQTVKYNEPINISTKSGNAVLISEEDYNVQNLLELISENPFQNPPPYERLIGNLKQCYLRRINSQHRLVYMVYEEEKIVKIISMWSHYEF